MKNKMDTTQQTLRDYVSQHLVCDTAYEGDIKPADGAVEIIGDNAWVPVMVRVVLACTECCSRRGEPHEDDDCPDGLVTLNDCI